ncbi:FAD:protein FMN transferase [Pseudomonadota bacterium]
MLNAKREKWLQAFGSPCHLVIGDRAVDSDELLQVAQDEFSRLEAKFGSHFPDSIISAINQAAGTGAYIQLDAEGRSLFEYVTALWEQSNHLFDPSTRVLRECYSPAGQLLATAQQLQGMLKLVGWSELELCEQGVRLPTRGMVINLDNCVRPYAVDSVGKLLRRNGVKNALIEMDRDVASIGKQPDGANWLVGVRHPKGPRTAIARLKLNNQGFAMRGNFERRIKFGGEHFGRALSPVDGQPLPGLLSVAVVADNCLTACSAASIARVKTEQAGIRWLETLGLPWLAIDRELNCIGPLSPH